ncbi:class III poly(R)-hydroxyalkanoic acid synthase subunit PhaE [Dokdonella sp. MW10]|uniref:class III poly(R)-hydroxyalkanoic acid synthase subunit PhaE n=1 Tax=Dokdonella sp. MW10 TaxID=2992926 RepID=UPI003F7D1D0C
MSEPFDMSQWARQWEALSKQAAAAMPGLNAFGGGGSPFPGMGAPFGMPPGLGGLFGAMPGFGGAMPGMMSGAMPGMTPGAMPGMGALGGDLLERLATASQGYLGLLQAMGGQGGSSWAELMQSAAAPMQGAANPFASFLRQSGSHGAAGFDAMMQRFLSVAGPMLGQAKDALGTPAFGFLREHQENAQAGVLALIEYQEQNARYQRLMLKVAEQGFATFQRKLADREEPGRQIDSVRGVYDLWVDAIEEAYAVVALSEEFREVYGALVNAQMRVRSHVQREVERISNDLGVPTRSEIDSLGERLQALRRQFREAQGGEDVASLRAEIDALRDEVAALRKAQEARSNVVAFRREASAADTATAAKPQAAAPAKAAKPARKPRKPVKKQRSVPQVARPKKASVATPAAPRKVSASKARTTVATATADAPQAATSFADRIARFARTARGDAPSTRPAAARARRGKR